MPLLARPAVAAFAAKAMQRISSTASRRAGGRGSAAALRARLPEYACATRELSIPTAYGPARAVLYLPTAEGAPPPPVHVNFHGGGYVLPEIELDDALCRCIAVEAGAAVLNVDYVVAPQHPFPAPPRQAYEIVRRVAGHGAEHGWDGGRLSVGGQSAGGGLAAAVARQALEEGGPPIALQVLHYPPLDLATGARDKRASIAEPMLRPWMADVFDSAYIPDPKRRADRLASPAHPSDRADLRGIAPAFVVTAEFDLLKSEGVAYADRLRTAGSLVGHHDVRGADHGYDTGDDARAREVYPLIAARVRQALHGGAAEGTP
ncbi:alpha/beta hydrolase fold domain-containing protein [Streptomyces caniscabiei]|uniref:Alpha/beta hydrolase fold domain-containing protein n=1 Tax=Streptomyces caniscabiei TaxID=2746961 RepID=A0A927KYX9_9ACTN|nr:alpha/beta hydrolase fold domain-containing protein [Streptomyces caniscabiei]MBD9722417.1 alpha/beta hydrolase fold domain-containing protein [Streptomyces caniscabiei]MDX3514343.1 alpha/beta hydrolase fold domain-containing protein [Streptomyces caniscabiei]MDX3716631.1 alpha/beta hydrolase fold domain-containing protein [Streptomyces caniscabiei]WEO22519.1 alpha/beta hydrolase fold domain-containing protein [Streptomyces caniscabiei]